MNGFRKMQETLGRQGWFVGWNLPCCQTCAWGEASYLAEDTSKVLFNHSQDCEVDDEEECPTCMGDAIVENPEYDTDQLALEHDDDLDEFIDCPDCEGSGYVLSEDKDLKDYDTSIGGFVCNYPEQQSSSLFCFDGSPEGVENLKAIIPIIEECGCTVSWNETGDSRIDISW